MIIGQNRSRDNGDSKPVPVSLFHTEKMNEKVKPSVLLVEVKKLEEIIRRCIEKDAEAIEFLYEKYKSKVYRTSYLLSNNASLADDITQEAFIRIFSKMHLYKKSYSFDSWIYKIVLNVYRNICRKQKWTVFLPISEDIPITEDTCLPSLEQNEQKELLADIINTLPARVREVIILKYYTDLSQEEIAKILKIPLGTVKSRINTGLKKIRKQIETDASVKEVLIYERIGK